MAKETMLPAKVESKEVLQRRLKQTIKAIDDKLIEIGAGTASYIWKSPGNFKMNENDSNNINILSHPDLNYLIKALAKMRRVKKEYEDTAKEEGLDSYPVCLWLAVPIDNWISDLEIRVKLVGNQVLINELTTNKTKLMTHLSEEERLSGTLTKVAALLKKK